MPATASDRGAGRAGGGGRRLPARLRAPHRPASSRPPASHRPVPHRPARPRRPARLHPLRWSARLRLTLLYGGLFLVSGAALLGITYFLVSRAPATRTTLVRYGGGGGSPDRTFEPSTDPRLAELRRAALQQHEEELRTLLTESGIALAVMTVVSVALGWVVAGRVLRPVRLMAGKARRISERNLHERLAVAGPDDELKHLGDTFDGLLARLDTAFEAQRRFVANASHELRTPLTLQRAVIEVALSDPGADARSLRAVCERVLAAGEHQERLIEALLTLASSQRGLDRSEPLDLAAVTASVLRDHRPAPDGGPRVDASLSAAATRGNPGLVERLVTNLLENALRYNVPGGWVRVTTGTWSGRPSLHVANSGPAVPPDRVPALFQPFQRLRPRTSPAEGHGLGLSIVAAVATAHGAAVTTAPGPEGGLAVTVAFPHAAPDG